MKYYKTLNNEVFAYDDEQVAQGYGTDLTAITEDEMKVLTTYIPTREDEINTQIAEAKTYLADTSWYIERLNDPSSGKAIPEEVLSKRAEARELINTLEAELKELEGVNDGN